MKSITMIFVISASDSTNIFKFTCEKEVFIFMVTEETLAVKTTNIYFSD